MQVTNHALTLSCFHFLGIMLEFLEKSVIAIPTGHSLYFHPIMDTITLTLLVQNQSHYDTVLLNFGLFSPLLCYGKCMASIMIVS